MREFMQTELHRHRLPTLRVVLLSIVGVAASVVRFAVSLFLWWILFVPVALLLRLRGTVPGGARPVGDTDSYWEACEPTRDVTRYLRPF